MAIRGKHAAFALGRLKVGQQNATEREYGAVLDARRSAGEVAWSKFEGLKLRLADNTFYTPDYAVMLTSGDNVLKAAGDGLNGIVWRDDAQIASAQIIKLYSETPRLIIEVRELPQ